MEELPVVVERSDVTHLAAFASHQNHEVRSLRIPQRLVLNLARVFTPALLGRLAELQDDGVIIVLVSQVQVCLVAASVGDAGPQRAFSGGDDDADAGEHADQQGADNKASNACFSAGFETDADDGGGIATRAG